MVSRRQKKELKQLRKAAEELWADQQALLDRATLVFRQSSKQAGKFTSEELVPKIKVAYEELLKPSVDRGVVAGQAAAADATQKFVDSVVPAVAGVAAAVATVFDSAKDEVVKKGGELTEKAKHAASSAPVVRKAIDSGLAAAAIKQVERVAPPKKKTIGFGGIVGITLAALAALGIGYAVWQTLRADDDLWVADDEPEVPPADEPTS